MSGLYTHLDHQRGQTSPLYSQEAIPDINIQLTPKCTGEFVVCLLSRGNYLMRATLWSCLCVYLLHIKIIAPRFRLSACNAILQSDVMTIWLHYFHTSSCSWSPAMHFLLLENVRMHPQRPGAQITEISVQTICLWSSHVSSLDLFKWIITGSGTVITRLYKDWWKCFVLCSPC